MNSFLSTFARIRPRYFVLMMIAGGCGMIWLLFHLASRPDRTGAVAVTAGTPARESVPLRFGELQNIAGTSLQMLPLQESGGGKLSGYSVGGADRNLLFLADDGARAKWVFRTHEQRIFSIEHLGDRDEKKSLVTARALYLEYANADTNGDGKLSYADQLDVAVAKPDGTGMADVVKRADRVLSHKAVGASDVAIVYQTGSKIRYVRFDFATMTKKADQEIASIEPGQQ